MRAGDMGAPTTALGGLDMTCIAATTLAAEARQRIGYRLASWGLGHLGHDARLIAAELISNACAATPEAEVRIRFTREPGGVALAVWDSAVEMPRVKPVVELAPEDLDLS